ncbi:Hypothetical protein CpCap5W_0588 [Corynebacterium pseudotuberculosis]|nr:Hypothetical protein CpPAT10_0559b [Corynebacterium pseudotuberculosis PAT10]AEX39034.1 Hypothetical protein Cp3995_0565 [Corynebacterium pseudotuberculosis 3/99-5]AFF21713.1 Hypothetical protein CpP54B96_0566 [Corynebacterium pseudotuberculosis P54B96]AFH51486.1 Hypothetical protein Cp267_0581 [Corynebacterium pseudotuberculosis 267]AIG06936.1 hypothetical protein CPTA_01107 [Corynebacterium pseudotuberculosis]
MVFDKNEEKVREIGNDSPRRVKRGIIPEETKTLVEKCLGVGFFSGGLPGKLSSACR